MHTRTLTRTHAHAPARTRTTRRGTRSVRPPATVTTMSAAPPYTAVLPGQKKAEPKRKRGKSDRDKLVERLMYQNMKTYEMLEKYGIMQNPKDLTNLEKFIKQGSRTALRQAVDTQRALGLLDLEREAIQRATRIRETEDDHRGWPIVQTRGP